MGNAGAARLVGLDAGVVVNPVGLPGLAAVGGEGLFGLRVVFVDGPDAEANENHAAVVRLLVDELAAAVFEAADDGAGGGSVEYADAAGGKAGGPLMCGRAVEAECEKLEVTIGAVGLDLRDVAAAVPEGAVDGGAVHVGPGGGTSERMNEAVHVNLPGADVPVEGVCGVEVAGRIREGQSSGGYIRGRLCIGAARELCVEGDVPCATG